MRLEKEQSGKMERPIDYLVLLLMPRLLYVRSEYLIEL